MRIPVRLLAVVNGLKVEGLEYQMKVGLERGMWMDNWKWASSVEIVMSGMNVYQRALPLEEQ